MAAVLVTPAIMTPLVFATYGAASAAALLVAVAVGYRYADSQKLAVRALFAFPHVKAAATAAGAVFAAVVTLGFARMWWML